MQDIDKGNHSNVPRLLNEFGRREFIATGFMSPWGKNLHVLVDHEFPNTFIIHAGGYSFSWQKTDDPRYLHMELAYVSVGESADNSEHTQPINYQTYPYDTRTLLNAIGAGFEIIIGQSRMQNTGEQDSWFRQNFREVVVQALDALYSEIPPESTVEVGN